MELIETIKELADADELTRAIRAARERIRELKGYSPRPPGRPARKEITVAVEMREQGEVWSEVFKKLHTVGTMAQMRLRQAVRMRRRRTQRRARQQSTFIEPQGPRV
jgi:hypothetical protein